MQTSSAPTLHPPLASFPFFDEPFGKYERVPRTFRIVLRETELLGRTCVKMVIKDTIPIGDPQIDNNYVEDGYRFHDALHAAFLAHLAWSPVLRTVMRRRRRSDIPIHDVEDTGRAVLIEETIVTLVHNAVRAEGLRSGITRIDPVVLRTILDLTHFLEVKCYTSDHWEHAILSGLDCWRQCWLNRGGLLRGNLHQRTLVYEPAPPPPDHPLPPEL
ncbi:MAG: hypothetical protein U0R19_21465 [Bryobacteraceae bacterium]